MARPQTSFRLVALATAFAAWALVALGGVVRITESGLGCPDWPLCEGRVLPRGSTAAAIEFSHRAAATLVTVLVLVVAAWAWRRYRSRRDVLVPALVAAALIPGQALLGAVVVWLELPGWIVGFHFAIGLLFLAATVLVATAARARTGKPASRGFVRLVWATAATGFLLVCAGAAVVSAHADEACGEEWPACNGAFVTGGADAAIHVTHRSLAYLTAALAAGLAVLAWRRQGPRLAGALPLAAVLAQLGLGIAVVLAGEGSRAHGPLASAHVAGAAAVWALLVVLTSLAGRLSPAPSLTVRLRAPAHAR